MLHKESGYFGFLVIKYTFTRLYIGILLFGVFDKSAADFTLLYRLFLNVQ